MFKINRFADYATIVMDYMAQNPNKTYNAREIAENTPVHLPTVTKILKLLAKNQLLESHRGAKGGYSLTRAPEDISIAAIIEAIDGPLALTKCSDAHGYCELEPLCNTRHNWRTISHIVYDVLAQINLAQMRNRHFTISLLSKTIPIEVQSNG